MSSLQVSKVTGKSNTGLGELCSLQYWLRRAVLKHLAAMPKGRLVINDGSETLAVGELAESAKTIAHIDVHDRSVYQDIALNGVIGAGEAYMSGAWSSPDLVKVIRFFVANMHSLSTMDGERSFLNTLFLKVFSHLNRNTLTGAKKNISAHYDLGNEFFSLFLDETMMYSSAIYADHNTSLEVAATEKLEQVCQKLRLQPSDHLLEIGTGWGGMAIYAAQNYGCKVTTTTISKQQYEYARAKVKSLGLERQVEVIMQDYRELRGRYDKLVSIEMIEAVGHEYFSSYFQRCSDLLKPEGLMVIQAITIADQRYEKAKRSMDFIKRYIFPGGCLPSIQAIAHHVANDSDMTIMAIADIGRDYALTLKDWRNRFMTSLDHVRSQGFDEGFIRMWEYYLCYCEGGFLERAISTSQIVMAKPAFRLDERDND